MEPSMLRALATAHTKALDATVNEYEPVWEQVARITADALANAKTILFCGNGGSACDAMHIAGEFVGRFIHDRPALPAIALSADSGIITAVGNDYGFEQIFSRQVAAYGSAGSVLIAMSTSGTSPNVVRAIEAANAKGMITVLLTGERGRAAPVAAHHRIAVASSVTAHVQEVHILLLHALASMVERHLGHK